MPHHPAVLEAAVVAEELIAFCRLLPQRIRPIVPTSSAR